MLFNLLARLWNQKRKKEARRFRRNPFRPAYELLEERVTPAFAIGDMAITGYAADDPDTISIVLLKDANSGEQFTVLDEGWLSTQAGFRGTGEGETTFQFNSLVPAGTQITLNFTNQTYSNGITAVAGATDRPTLATGGDQIFIYDGGFANRPTSGTSLSWVAAFQMNGSGAWDSNATDSNTSAKPTAFTDGDTSFAGFNPEVDNAVLNNLGNVSGTPAQIRAIVYAASNWTTNDITPPTIPGSTTFTVNGAGNVAPTITSANNTQIFQESAGTFQVSATGTPSTFTFSLSNFSAGASAAWITIDSAGLITFANNGSRPVVTTNTNYTFDITVANGTLPDAVQSFTLTDRPVKVFYSTAGSSYTQNFDNLLSPVPADNTTVSNTVLPNGWSFTESGANANTTLRVDDGESGTGDTYLYGTAASNERAFGSFASGSLTSVYGARFHNSTGSDLTSFNLKYTGEQWKDGGSGSAVPNTLAFSYSTDGITFTPVTALDFLAPISNTTADVALDGNNPLNQVAVGGVSGITVNGIVWAPNTSLFIRWTDINDPGNDDGLALDNLTFSASGPPTDGIIQFAAAKVTVAENVVGGNLVLTVKRLGDGTGTAVTADITVTNITTSGADYGTPTPATQVSWGVDDYADKTITIPITDDALNEGDERFLVTLSNVTGGTASLGSIPSATVTIDDDNFVAPAVVLNELLVNPTDTDDAREYVELRTGTTATSLGGVWLLEIEGAGTAAGTVDRAFDLTGLSTGTAGLITLGNGYNTSNPWGIVAGATTLANLGTQALENGTTTYLLVTNFTGAVGDDLDAGQDGTFDVTPWEAILDSVGWTDSTDSSPAPLYTTVALTQSSGTPDGATRFPGNTTPITLAAWYNADLIDTGTAALDKTYDPTKASANLPAGGRLTPGAANYDAPAEGVFQIAQASYTVAENGGSVVITVNRLGGTTGPVDVPFTINFTGSATAADIGTPTPATQVSFAAGDNTPQTITIPIVNPGVADPEGFESFTVSLGTPTAGVLGVITSTTVGITDDDTAAPSGVLLNEIDIDPGSTDNPYEYAEIIGPASAPLYDLYFVGFEGDGTTQRGEANYLKSLNGTALGASGLLVIKAGVGGFSIPSGVTVVTDSNLTDGTTSFQNGTNSFLLIFSPTPLVAGFDYDANDDGTLELLPAGAVIVDGIAKTDGGAGDLTYGTAVLTSPPTVDAATRIRGNSTANSAAAWYYGTLNDTDQNTTTYTALSTGAPTNAVLTPGTLNFPSPGGVIQFTTSALSWNEGSGTIDIFVTRSGATNNDPASVTYTITAGTADQGVDYSTTGSIYTGTLNWPDAQPANATQHILIDLTDDTEIEPNQTFTITLSNASGADLSFPFVQTETITDNDVAYHVLTGGNLTQDWANTGLITNDDEWNLVPSIRGFRGDGLDTTTLTPLDPQTILAPGITRQDIPPGVIDVNANQTDPETFTSGGVTEFQLANPTIGLIGSGTADAPFLVLYLDTTGVTTGVRVQYDIRDLELADNAIQPVALQYRIGETGNFINVPGAFVADATTTGNTLVTSVDATLPAAVNGQPKVQIRIIGTNAGGNDEAIGIDNIVVSQAPVGAGVIQFSATTQSVNEDAGTISITVTRTGGSSGAVSATFAVADVSTEGAGDYGTATVNSIPTTTISWANGDSAAQTIVIPIVNDADGTEGNENFTVTLTGTTGGASLGANNPITVTITNDDPTYFAISTGTPFTENWDAPNPVLGNDSWDFTQSIIGYLGDNLSAAPGTDPQTVTGEGSQIDVIANQANPNTLTSGGVAEFDGIANPTIALQGSSTADAPNIVLHINASAITTGVRVQYDVRDIDGSTDNAIQQVALQYRIGDTGPFINVPIAFVADATEGPSLSTKVTSVDTILPAAVNGQAFVQIRIITNDASGSDEWVGIDNIVVSEVPAGAGTIQFTATSAVVNEEAGNIVLTVTRTGGISGAVSATFAITDAVTNGTQGAADYGTPTPLNTVSWAAGDATPQTITIPIVSDNVDENLESFVVTLTAGVGSPTIGANNPITVTIIDDDVSYHPVNTSNLTQDWSDASLITLDDVWSNVPSIIGYRGDDAAGVAPVNPQTTLDPRIASTDTPAGVVDVNANQTNPNTFFTGGVTEFAITNPTIALTGSGTADAPFILLHIDATGVTTGVRVQYNIRDLETVDNAVQPVALQYRIGTTGNFIDVPAAFVADATNTLDTLVTPVDVTLPAAVNGQSQVQVRIITGDATGNDEWVGIDDIVVSKVAAANTAPTITSNGGGATASINVAENTTAVTTVTVTDPEVPPQTITYTLSGPDAAKFQISPSGVLTFITAPDFEAPTDVGTNNVYNVTVTASDNGTPILSDSQDIAVTVTDVAAGTISFSPATHNVTEGNVNSNLTITVSRSGGTDATSVNYATSDGPAPNATQPSDYLTATGSLSWGVGDVANKTFQVTIVGDTTPETPTAENFTITLTSNAGTAGATLGSPAQVTINDDDAPATFAVTSTTVLDGGAGFLVTFNAAYDISALNLYTGDIGATLDGRDVKVSGPSSTNFGIDSTDEFRLNAIPVNATQLALLVSGPNRVADVGRLAAGSYTLTLEGGSGNAAFKRLSDGAFLDGNANGTVAADDDYVATPTVNAIDLNTTAVVSIGDVVAGPGQTVTAPLVLTGDVSDVTSVDLVIANTTTFTVTAFTVNTGISGIAALFNPATGILTMSSATPFQANDNPLLLGTFTFQIPGLGNPGVAPTIGLKSVVDINVTSVANTVLLPKPYFGTDGFHVSAYIGDVSATTGSYTGADVSGIQQLIVQSVGAYSLYQNIDPRVIADTNADGNINGADVSNVQLRIVNNPLTSIPALPSGSSGIAVAGPDPRIFLDTSAIGPISPGQQDVLVPVKVTNTDVNPITITTADIAVQFDSNVFTFDTLLTGPISNGTLGSGLAVWSTLTNVVSGNIMLATGSAAQGPQLAVGQTEILYYLRFDVKPTATFGTTTLNLLNNGGFTTMSNNTLQPLTLVPAVSDSVQLRANGFEDDQLVVQAAAGRLFANTLIPANPGQTLNIPVFFQAPAGGTGVASADLKILFDPTKLSISNTVLPGAIADGSLGGSAFSILANQPVAGTLLMTGSAAQGPNLAGNSINTLYIFQVTVLPGVTNGEVIPFNIGNSFTNMSNNFLQPIGLAPAPDDTPTQANVDGSLLISVQLNQPPFVQVPASSLNVAVNTIKTMAGRGYAFSTASSNAITVSDPNTNDSNIRLTLSVPTGTLTLGSTVGVTVVSGDGTGTVVVEGSQANLTTAINGLLYRSPSTFNGNVLLTITANDQSTNFGGALTDTKYVNITVVRAFINEVLFNPPSTDAPNEYIEIRTTVPNFVFPANTFFIGLEANGVTASNGANSGSVNEIFSLSGKSTGANGILVLRQQGSTYTPGPDANVITSTAPGFTGANIGFSTNNAGGTDIENAGTTFLLLTLDDGASTVPTLGTDIDADNNAAVDGTQYGTWAINDSVGILTGATSGTNIGYGAVNFVSTTSTVEQATTGTLVNVGTWNGGYVARVGNSTGDTSADWLVSEAGGTTPGTSGFSGTGPTNWALPTNTFTGATGTFVGKVLNAQIGRENFWVNGITSVAVNGFGSQRSQVTSLVVNFNNPVTAVDSSKISVTGWVGAVATNVALAGDGLSATITFTSGADTYTLANPFQGSSVALLDGRYTLTILAGAFSDASGGIDIDGDGSAGGTRTVNFHRFFGDTDGDGDVDATDRNFFNNMVDNNDENGNGEPDGFINSFDDVYFAFLDYSNNDNIDRTNPSNGGGNPLKDYANVLLNFRRRTLAAGAPGGGVPASYLSKGPRI